MPAGRRVLQRLPESAGRARHAKGGTVREVYACCEVALAAGAITTPRLLRLCGNRRGREGVLLDRMAPVLARAAGIAGSGWPSLFCARHVLMWEAAATTRAGA